MASRASRVAGHRGHLVIVIVSFLIAVPITSCGCPVLVRAPVFSFGSGSVIPRCPCVSLSPLFPLCVRVCVRASVFVCLSVCLCVVYSLKLICTSPSRPCPPPPTPFFSPPPPTHNAPTFGLPFRALSHPPPCAAPCERPRPSECRGWVRARETRLQHGSKLEQARLLNSETRVGACMPASTHFPRGLNMRSRACECTCGLGTCGRAALTCGHVTRREPRAGGNDALRSGGK